MMRKSSGAAAPPKMISVPGSRKRALPNARAIGPAPRDERFNVTVRIRPRTPLPRPSDMLRLSAQPVSILTHDQFNELYGANPKDIIKLRTFAKDNNLAVARESVSRRSVILSGTVADFNKAFVVNLKTYETPHGTYRGRVGSVHVPAALGHIVEGVFGLDNRPVAKRRRPAKTRRPATRAHAFNPNQVARLYNFPVDADGNGQTIGIIELGGGYRPEDLQNYFTELGLPVPEVIPVSVDGATNSPSTANSDDGEVVLDIEVASAVAPGARIVVYFTTNDRASDGFLDAITKAVHDDQYNPSVISISWGGPEDLSATGFQEQFNQVLQEAALLGVTVCVAAGDDGAADMGPKAWDGKAHVDFPASSPFALSCGGTRLLARRGTIARESVWNQHQADLSEGQFGSFGSGGGGVSGAFRLPPYQANANVPASLNPRGFKGRGVPDVTGAGDPESGYNILVDGQAIPVGGTSAVAPLWAGLIARINQKLGGRIGFINPQLYALPDSLGAFHDITVGNNQCTFKRFRDIGYQAGPGWDPCGGLGSPDGTKLSSALRLAPISDASATGLGKAGRIARQNGQQVIGVNNMTEASQMKIEDFLPTSQEK